MWVQSRHFTGGNILFMDGHVDLITPPQVKDPQNLPDTENPMKIEYWEPGYQSIYPPDHGGY